MGQLNIKLQFDKYFIEVDGMHRLLYFANLITLRHDRGSSDVKPCNISSLLLNIAS